MKSTIKYIFPLFLLSLSLQAKFITITSEKQFQNLVNTRKPLILKFTADYCPPCKVSKIPYEEVAKEPEFKDISFLEIDTKTPAGSSISNRFKIMGIPAFIYMKDGKEVNRVVGLAHPAKFKEDLRNNLRTILLTSEKPEESDLDITAIEIEEEAMPAPIEEKPTAGLLGQLFLSIQAFFIFIIDTIKGIINYIINLIKGIFGK